MKKTTSTPQWVLLCGWILLIQPVIAQVNSLSTRVFDKKSVQPNTVIVDVRTPAEWRAGHITGARLHNVLETDSFNAQIANWDKSATYLLYCRSGKRSQRALELMQTAGFNQVYDLAGGFLAWEESKKEVQNKIIKPLHRLVIQVTSGDTLVWKGLINNLKHLQAGWGDSAQILVVAHGPGIDLLRKEQTTQQNQITNFNKLGIQFLACENTMAERKITKESIVKESGFVKMGIGEIVRLQEAGWSYIKAGF